MPEYVFTHTVTGKTATVFFGMNEDKVYAGPDGKEVGLWKRVWLKPRMAVDSTNIDPSSAKDFVRATAKKDSIGAMWDRSAELSAKRIEKEGVDTYREAFMDQWSTKRRGKEHPIRTRAKAKQKLAKSGIDVDFGD